MIIIIKMDSIFIKLLLSLLLLLFTASSDNMVAKIWSMNLDLNIISLSWSRLLWNLIFILIIKLNCWWIKSRDLKTKWHLIEKFNFGFSIWSHPLLKKISVKHHCDCWPCMKSRWPNKFHFQKWHIFKMLVHKECLWWKDVKTTTTTTMW